MRISLLLKIMLAAALPMFATEDETAGAAPSSTEPAADQSAADAAPASTDAAAEDPTTPVADANASDASDASQDAASADTDTDTPAAAEPVVQTTTPVAQSGDAGDPVLETVKTPAHNVADEIQAEIKKLEQLPAEVAAWFESKFVELAAHIKALL